MRDLILFLAFLVYSSAVFFFPNNEWICVFVFINLVFMFFMRKFCKRILIRTLSLFPFVIFTFVFNVFLDSFFNAVCVGIKLIIVCNITMIYSCSTTVMRCC